MHSKFGLPIDAMSAAGPDPTPFLSDVLAVEAEASAVLTELA